MDKNQKRKVLREALALFAKGRYYSADPKDKNQPWLISIADGQTTGKVSIGDEVWVTVSRSKFQLVEILKEEGSHTDKEGLKRSLFLGKVIAEI